MSIMMTDVLTVVSHITTTLGAGAGARAGPSETQHTELLLIILCHRHYLENNFPS